MGGVRGRRGQGGGFTLVEVLIALVVLVVGILGIFALVPTSTRSAADSVDDLAASQEVHSVLAALRLAAREHHHEVWTGAPPARRLQHAFLLFPHPAALPPGQSPPTPLRADGSADPAVFDHPACLLLPHGVDKAFVYPRAAAPAGQGIARENGLGDAAAARDDLARPPGEPLVRRTFAGEDDRSFALLIERAVVDGQRVDGLYRVTVLLYRGFEPWDPASPTDEARPVATYTTELMVGPMSLPAGGR